ncbi:Acg family FMN-binding oxidoreductase [Actinoplanes sp. GCM10030250]|uniref:Acg family FMN-binding oxidoreductase n=1 Tax=Actinoplanes sp. GCM10030250 TaxID=3273376 RepID=UPI003620279A
MTEDADVRSVLARAANAARFAPSIHNTQPWRWIVFGDRLELHRVTDRQLRFQDPDRHMLLISCGTALHHARIALTAEGRQHRVERVGADPLAVVHPGERVAVDPAAIRHFEQLSVRHTDRRTVTGDAVTGDILDVLVKAAEQAGARLHVLGRDQVIELAVLVEQAQKAEDADELLRAESTTWVGGGRAAGTGIPDANLPAELPPTTVAERDFGASGTLAAGSGHDTAATYALLYGPGDEAVDWLRAGEALSAVWLTASEHGVALLPLSGPVEVASTRHQLRRLLGGIGFPHMVMRLGTFDSARPVPARTPRLPTEQVVEIRD